MQKNIQNICSLINIITVQQVQYAEYAKLCKKYSKYAVYANHATNMLVTFKLLMKWQWPPRPGQGDGAARALLPGALNSEVTVIIVLGTTRSSSLWPRPQVRLRVTVGGRD